MNYNKRLVRLGLCNFETRSVELSSLLKHGDTELEAQENNTLAKLLLKKDYGRFGGCSSVSVLWLTANAHVGLECRGGCEHREVRHLNFIPLLKLESTFVVREQRRR